MYIVPIGENIRKKREEKGLSRYALSKKANLGAYALARMEKEEHKTHMLRAKALCDALNCEITELFKINL